MPMISQANWGLNMSINRSVLNSIGAIYAIFITRMVPQNWRSTLTDDFTQSATYGEWRTSVRRIIAAFCLLPVLFVGGRSQLTNCRFVNGCNTETIAGACNVNVDYTRCSDDQLTSKRVWCYPTGCKRNCICSCQTQGYAISWCICPDETLVTQTYQCAMC
jgi:hypothetical protein